MAKDPADQCRKLTARIKKAMIDSRLVAFTAHESDKSVTSSILIWQTAADTHLIQIDYSDYTETGKYKATLYRGAPGEKGEVVPGECLLQGEYSKKNEWITAFDGWLKQSFRPPHIDQVHTNRLSP